MDDRARRREEFEAKTRFHRLLSSRTDSNGFRDLSPDQIEALKVEAGLVERPPDPVPVPPTADEVASRVVARIRSSEPDPVSIGRRLADVAGEDGRIAPADAIKVILGSGGVSGE